MQIVFAITIAITIIVVIIIITIAIAIATSLPSPSPSSQPNSRFPSPSPSPFPCRLHLNSRHIYSELLLVAFTIITWSRIGSSGATTSVMISMLWISFLGLIYACISAVVILRDQFRSSGSISTRMRFTNHHIHETLIGPYDAADCRT